MIKDIDSIFKAITPENIKDVPVIKDAMDVFIETLKDLSKESIDIRNAFENKNIKEQLVQVYLDDLYNVLQQVQLNEKLLDTVDRINGYYGDVDYLSKDAIINVSEYINTEHFLTFKSYKQNKGSEKAIQYIYELINSLVSINNEDSGFRFHESAEPFHLEIEGSLPEEFYEYIVYPLAHPLGFTYNYSRYVELELQDYFPEIDINYDTNKLEVRCLFPDGHTEIVKYIDNTITYQEKVDFGIDSTLKVTELKTIAEPGSRTKLVYLTDGTYLKQVTTNLGQSNVWLYDTATEVIIEEYLEQCSIYFDYTFTVNTAITETIDQIVKPISTGFFRRLDELTNNQDITVGYYPQYDYSQYEHQRIGSFTVGGVDENNTPIVIGDGGNVAKGVIVHTDIENGLHRMDTGWNYFLDNNGNFLIKPSRIYGRYEHHFAPDFESDLKILEGKFLYNYDILNDNNDVIYTQALKYTNTVEQTPVVSRVNSIDTYKQQNVGNEETLAREHGYDDLTFSNENNDYLENEFHPDFDNNTYATDSDGLSYFIKVVEAEAVNIQHDTEDSFDFGVYRNGNRLADNNVSAI
jgi:hypothetical protein